MISRSFNNYFGLVRNQAPRTGAAQAPSSLKSPALWLSPVESQLPACHPLIRRLYFGKTAPSAETLRVITFNAENCFENGPTEEQFRAKADVILQAQPDVIALQEVGDKAFLESFNRKYLNGEYPNILVEQCPQDPYHQVAYMGKAFVKMEGVSHYQEQTLGQYNRKRDFLEARLEARGYQWRMFNAHFRSMRWGEERSFPVRLEEAASAANILKRVFDENPGERVLVVGDTNSRHDSPLGRQVLDKLTLADEPQAPVTLKEVTQEIQERAGNRAVVMEPTFRRQRLDYVFASPGILADIVDAKVLGHLSKPPYNKASKHRPVLVVLQASQAAKPKPSFNGNSTQLNLIA